MTSIAMRLNEARDLQLYKKILNQFSFFIDRQPGTGMTKYYKALQSQGVKAMPKDKRALDILDFVTSGKSEMAAVQDLINKTFTDLPIDFRPVYKEGTKKLVAFWSGEGQIHSKIIDLLNLFGKKGAYSWADVDGKKVKLIDIQSE